MKVEVVNTPSPYPLHSREIEGVAIWCIGFLHSPGKDFCAVLYEALTSQGVLKSKEELNRCLRDLSGNFTCIVRDRAGHVVAATDKIRSYPMFYAQAGETIFVGSDPYKIKAFLPKVTRNQEAFLEFKMAGYVTGGGTLFNELRQLQAGEFLLCDGAGVLVSDYYIFYNPISSARSQDELLHELHEITQHIFQKLMERLAGRPVWIPLSGGLDSRLVLCMLKKLGYDNIQTFSYGIPGNCEAAAARTIAEKVGVSWFFVPYTRAFGRRVFQSKEREAYFHFAHELSGIPMMTDFYALHELLAKNKISKGEVLINGQTGDFISGEHIPDALDHAVISKEALVEAIIKKHYSLWTNLNTLAHLDIIRKRILRVLQKGVAEDMPRDDAMKQYELWEWRARQAQHVVAGQRVYDFFGNAWELPLWDDEYLDFWAQIPFEHKFRQVLYRTYLEAHDPFGVFRMQFRRYTPPRWAHWLENAFLVFGKRRDEYRRKYLKYWQKYAYFYAKDTYAEYIKYARYHRNPSSVLAKDILEREYGEVLM